MKKLLFILLLITTNSYGQMVYNSTSVQELGFNYNTKKWEVFYTWVDKHIPILVNTDYVKLHTTKDVILKIDIKTVSKFSGEDFVGIHYPAFDLEKLKECDVYIVKYHDKRTIITLLYREDLVQFKFLIE